MTSSSAASLHTFPNSEETGRKPWRYIGYRGFSSYMASDNDFTVIRRFDVLSTRVLLAMQDKITELEEVLSRLDAECMAKTEPELDNGSFRNDKCLERAETIVKLQRQLLEYKQFLWTHSELQSRPLATKHSRKNLKAWLWNHPETILDEESNFAYKDDLINVVVQRKSPLHDFLVHINALGLIPFLRAQKSPAAVDQATVAMYDNDKVDTLVNTLLLTFGLVMLIVPLWVLDIIQDTHYRLAFISCAIVLFLVLVAGLTAARPSEALAGTAAYSAVLMVFLQLGT